MTARLAVVLVDFALRLPHLDGLIRIGVGRDAAEIAFCSPFGGIVNYGPIQISIEPVDGFTPTFGGTVEAISTDEVLPAT